ncbi:Transcriptional regulator [Sulfitobacter noctilucicola]|uniref:LysR family nitrogen assimilation transcriptional regulator n=1 Tax=Sulfitobacter noctilucicola TaxID=1342301 RepID=A0A7W6Q7D2_9RHOB|nr:LysR family transcriptional regulator [Sulfitobacter noctilucicola]KIN66181.1 Transcriptional regulator [Sulfitobacter noctilucicola]MBB4175792.1 LysR family nitrogen assimilation transcriptional regulator [Sulfitobacter noctilucicola]
MDSRQLRYFAAIYEAQSVSRAAEGLNIAASALSHHLSNLETELATALFARKPRGMQATAAGERLYSHARGILRAINAATDDLQEKGREVTGDVSVGMSYSAVKAIGVDLMKSVMTDYPKLRLSLSESLSGSTLVHLMASEIDLAVVYNPPNDPKLRVQPILEEEMVCVGRADIIGDSEVPVTFQELLNLPLILLRQGLSARALLDDASLLKQLESRARFQMNSVQAIAGCLVDGLGCIVGTRLFMRELLEEGKLHARPITKPTLTRTLYICELADRPATFALEAVRQLIMKLIFAALSEGRWDAFPVRQAD